MFPIPSFYPATMDDLSWSDDGSDLGKTNAAGLHSFRSHVADLRDKNYFDPKNMTAEDYYGDLWNYLGSILGIGEAGRQAVWNAKMQDWQNTFNANQSQLERDFNAQQTSAQNAFNAEEALKEREWQERMSSTAYQRAVADLKSAGLNPVLAVAQPSSSGQGAYASGSALGASSFIGSALGANGINAGLGVTSISALANTALNVYKTRMLSRTLNHRDVDLMNKVISTLSKVFKFIK